MTAAPSQTPEAAGLEVVAWDSDVLDTFSGFSSNVLTRKPHVSKTGERVRSQVALVTAASAQAAIDAEKARADRLAKALKETRNRVREWPIDDHETCMCGSPVASHGMGDGHSPVSQGDHAISMIVEAINEALQQETQK